MNKSLNQNGIPAPDAPALHATEHDARLMRAMVAACAMVARADGKIDLAERKRIFRLMQAAHVFEHFARATVEAEFAACEQRFDYEPYSARETALDLIEALDANAAQARALLAACQQVLEADGVARAAEYRAVSYIGRALKSGGVTPG